MGVTRIRQDQVWTEGSAIDDTLAPTDHDANAVDLADTIDFLASQIADITGEVAWETAPDMTIAAMAAKKWLDDFMAIRDYLHLQDITVPGVVTGTGDDISGTAPTMTLTDAAGSFTANMVGRQITIAGATTPANNGTFPIVGYTSATVIDYTNASGVAETFSGTWSVSGANWKVLSAAGTETPSRDVSTVATTPGAVCAELGASELNTHKMTEIAGSNALNPLNLCIVFDATTGDPLLSSYRQIYALLQVEDGAVDGDPFDDANNQGQLSFVRPNATYDDLEACPIADIAGKSINYCYADRELLSAWSPQDFRRSAILVDLAAPGVAQSLDIAYNGGSQVAVDDTNVDWRLTDTKHFYISDSTGADKILDVAAASGGDTISIDAPGNITIVDGDIAGGTNKATWNSVEVGGATGQVASTGGADLVLVGADDITFTTVRQSALPLDDVTAGPISALTGGPFTSVSAAIKYAIEHGVDFNLGVTVLASNYGRDVNVPGGAGGLNIGSPHSIDMNTPGTVDTFLFLNGRLLYGGNGTTNNDVYAGTTPANGDIKFDFPAGVRTGDVVIALQISA